MCLSRFCVLFGFVRSPEKINVKSKAQEEVPKLCVSALERREVQTEKVFGDFRVHLGVSACVRACMRKCSPKIQPLDIYLSKRSITERKRSYHTTPRVVQE